MPSDTIAKVPDYKNSLIPKAEQLVNHGFPQKIMELNELLLTPMFHGRNLDEAHELTNIPFADATNGGLGNDHHADHGDLTGPIVLTACNTPICDMIKVIKPIIRKLVEDSNLLKMWISLFVPKIEEDNNFGVAIQKSTLREIDLARAQANTLFNQISDYFVSRTNVISKVIKYPFVDDYRRAVIELDEQEYFSLTLAVGEIRDHYSTLHDIIIKNIKKLKKPRSSNLQSFN